MELSNIENNTQYNIPERMDYIVIRIEDSDKELLSKIKEVLIAYLKGLSIPEWFKSKSLNWTEEDLWRDEFLMPYKDWIDKIQTRNWSWYASEFDSNSNVSRIVLLQNGLCNLSELIYIIHYLGINVESISIEDSVYGFIQLNERY